MDIETIIKGMEEEYPEGNRTRMDWELQIGDREYKLIAYKVATQNLIRIDIRRK